MSDWKKLREIAETVATRNRSVKRGHPKYTANVSSAEEIALTDGVLALLDENDSLRAEVERLRVLTLNPGATIHGSTITEVAEERAEYHEMLRTILSACDDSTRASIGRDAPLRAVRKVIAERDSLRQQCQRMRALLSLIRDDFDIAVSAHDPSDPRHPSHGGQHTNGLCCSFGNVTPGAVTHMRRMRDVIDAAIGKDGGNG